MKRKFFVIASLILILSLTVFFCACNPDDTPSTDEPGQTVEPTPDDGEENTGNETACTITYTATDGVIYSTSNATEINKGESLTFEFTLDVFYEGTPTVQVNGNDKTVKYDEDKDVYSCKMTVVKNSTVTVGGIVKAESELLVTGSGASDSPFVIRKPIDLVKMAEVINSGADDSVMSVLGYYVLENDIDLKGQELPIIGDGNNGYAFFGGYFNGNGHTISNFKINSNGKDFVGLFGVVQAYYYDELGYTGGMIYNLKLSDYTITAQNNGSTVTCGSFVGEGFGANLVLCEAKNGTIDVMGNVNYFSYAGGIIGLQRSYEFPYYSKVTYCTTDNVNIICSSGTTYASGGIAGYVYTDDDTIASTITNCYSTGKVSGAYHAGGIVGWLSNYSSVNACYSTCEIHAQAQISDTATMEEYCHAYAGGLVGMAQLDTVISDSFATGTVSAYAVAGSSYAHTGDFVGRVENLEDGLYGAKDMSVFNCYYVKGGKNDSIDLTKADTVKTKLGWHEIDWIFADGSYPVVNDTVNTSNDDDSTVTHYTYTVTLDFGGRTDKDGYAGFSAQFTDQYESMGYWYQVYEYSEEDEIEGIPATICGKNGYASYGYFFDSALTIAVPCSYVPMRDITLYVGFADNNEVAGTYYLVANSDYEENNNITIELVLKADGTYSCTDVYGTYEGAFVYNGEYAVFDDARFARYYGDSNIENYQAYEFKAVKTTYGFDIYGALYSDEELSEVVELVPRDNPLKAYNKENVISGSYYYVDADDTVIFEFFVNGSGYLYENGIENEFTYEIDGQTVTIDVDGDVYSGVVVNGVVTSMDSVTLTETDAFRGKWELSALPDKYIEFDGAGNWKYAYYGYTKSDNEFIGQIVATQTGTYTVDGDGLTLNNGAKVSFADGFVSLVNGNESYVFGNVGGYYGLWTTTNGDTLIELKGLTANGYGIAKIRFITETNGRVRNEIYELTYAPDILSDGSINFFYEGEYYGSAYYNGNNGVLICSVYSLTESDFVALNTYRIDEYRGEWISKDSTFGVVEFNGYGIYTAFGEIALNGVVSFGGNEVSYRLDDFSLSGLFTYNGNVYEISFDEGRNIITIESADINVELIEKDEFGGKTFLDEDGNTYEFDGKGYLSSKGTIKVNGSAVYNYAMEREGVALVYSNDEYIGTLSADGAEGARSYVLKINGQEINLGEKTAFTGTWALAMSFNDPVIIGTMNYDNVIYGKVPLSINGKNAVRDAKFILVDDEYLVWDVQEGLRLYVIKIADGMFVMSQHLNWFNYENDIENDEWYYSYMMTPDALMGKWSNNYQSQVYVFDGMGLNPEELAMYSITNMYASDDDSEEAIRYYGYFARKDGSGYDYLIFTNYSTYAQSALKVNFKAPAEGTSADEYINEDGTMAFTVESVDLKGYNLIRE